jgi:ketosteroid isomerase-like protein
MTSANVELVRRGYEAIARGDLDAVREMLDPAVKWHGGDENAPGACHGSDEALAFMATARRRGGGPIAKLVDVIDLGEQVVVVFRPPGASEGETALRANLTTIRDGKVVEMVAHESPEAALAAARVN